MFSGEQSPHNTAPGTTPTSQVTVVWIEPSASRGPFWSFITRKPQILLLSVALLAVEACNSPSTSVGGVGTDATYPDLFHDVTSESGVDFTYRNGEEAGHYAILESLGGGVALLDYDGDGLLDIFIA